MNRPALRRSIFVLSLAIPLLSAGCNRHLANASSEEIAKNTPEERFKRILDSFRRKIEDQPVGFIVSEGGSRTTMMGTNKVSSELIRPKNPDGQYKAVITVTSQSRYSLHTRTALEEAEHEQRAKNQGSNPLADPKESGTGVAGPDSISTAGSSQSASKITLPEEDTIARRPNDDVRKYELHDEGGRWVLITKPDPKTEQSIQFAFSEALAHQ